jgi:hypothetical protein
LYRCETWFLIVIDENRWLGHENGVLRRIYGPKREEVTRGWRKVHNEELHNFYSLVTSMRVRWVGYKAHMGVTEIHTEF